MLERGQGRALGRPAFFYTAEEIEMTEAQREAFTPKDFSNLKPPRPKRKATGPDLSLSALSCPVVLTVALTNRNTREKVLMHRVLWPWPLPIAGGDTVGLPQVTNTGDVVLNPQIMANAVMHDLLNNACVVELGHASGEWKIDPGSWDRQIELMEKAGFRRGPWAREEQSR
jgi:hypothetical protein